jgi:hypothetical protein
MAIPSIQYGEVVIWTGAGTFILLDLPLISLLWLNWIYSYRVFDFHWHNLGLKCRRGLFIVAFPMGVHMTSKFPLLFGFCLCIPVTTLKFSGSRTPHNHQCQWVSFHLQNHPTGFLFSQLIDVRCIRKSPSSQQASYSRKHTRLWWWHFCPGLLLPLQLDQKPLLCWHMVQQHPQG